MTKHCECQVISFPASIDQCHWVAIAGSHSIVRYGLGTGGQHEGIVYTTLTYSYMILPQYLALRFFCRVKTSIKTIEDSILAISTLQRVYILILIFI